MDQKELISIIMPTYNRGYIIGRTIKNILEQTYQKFELLIIDDASTDQTQEVVNAFADSRIIYRKYNQNAGGAHARNVGIKLAKGDIICFQDSDDLWETDKLEKQLCEMRRRKAGIIFSRIRTFGVDGTLLKITPEDRIQNTVICYNELLLGNIVPMTSLMIKKECMEDVFFDERLPRFQDWDFTLQLLKKNQAYYFKHIVGTQYIQQNSITCNHDKALKAMDIIFDKNKIEMQSHKPAMANYYKLYGYFEYMQGISPRKSYLCSFKYQKDLKILIKILLSNTKLLQYFFKKSS